MKAKNLAIRTFSDDPLAHVPTDEGNVDTCDVLLLLLGARPKSGAGKIAVAEEGRHLAAKHARKTIAVSFGSPYILRELGDVSTFVCAWGIQPVLQIAAMDALRGVFEMTGRLPVTIP